MSIKNMIKRIITKMQHTRIITIPETVSSNHLLEGSSALIIGGTSGIGLSIAQEFVKNGSEVIIAGRNKEKIDNSLKMIGNEEGTYGIVVDLENPIEFQEKINAARMICSSGQINILVNCAGVRSDATFLDCKQDDFDSVYRTNIRGTYLFSQEMGKYMIENGIKGHILNVSSSSALRPAQSPYQISKWAVRGMTLGMADALFPYGIIVNGIAPGPTATPMLGVDENGDIGQDAFYLGRYELPREIGQLAVIMVSPLGNVIVGDTLYATGGSGVVSMHK